MDTSGLPNVKLLDAETALNGRRLCETSVGLLEERGVPSWTTAGAVDVTEWVSQIRTVTTIVGPYQLQEGGHPSYWGQLALRSCLRLAYIRPIPFGSIRSAPRMAAGISVPIPAPTSPKATIVITMPGNASAAAMATPASVAPARATARSP